ncbi:MAG: glycosyltransferase family 2 protein [Gammaproteobacteria bacterium]|nr:glycosyltransferase family 2 protein [Gammaproteobacteria bacterium]
MTLLDISIVTYNAQQHIDKLIVSLLAQQQIDLQRVSITFLDNCSYDGTLARLQPHLAPLEASFYRVNLITMQENGGFGRGHNRALAEGDGEYVFILNPDIELHPLALATLLAAAAASDAKVAAWEARQLPYEHPKIYDPVTLEVSWASAAALMVRRSVFSAIGGFDSVIFLYGEDVELSWRLQHFGWRLQYVPRAIVWHYTYSEVDEIKPLAFVGSTRANLLLRSRYGTVNEVIKGLRMQLGILLIPSRHHFRGQRRAILGTFRRFWGMWQQRATYQQSPHRPYFSGWDYSPHRHGAFYDAGLAVKTLATLPKPPKISLLIRTMGRQPLLRMALQSVVNQTYRHIEVVLIEDGVATLNDFILGFPALDIRYHALGENRGRCIAGNTALELATGEYLLFLDEDDLLYADHLEQLLGALLRQQGKVAYSYTYEIPSDIDPQQNTVVAEGEYLQRFNRHFHFIPFLSLNYIPINAVLFHRSLYELCGGFDPELEMMEDWNLWVRFSLHYRPFIRVAKTTALYRVPLYPDMGLERRQRLIDYLHLAREKQARLPLTLQVSDLQDLSGGMVEAVSLEEILVNRAPNSGRLIRLVMALYRRTLGRLL